MKIGIFTDTYYPDINGVATATKIQRDILLSHGHQVFVVTTGLKGQKSPSYRDGILRIPGLPLKFLYNYRMSSFFNHYAFDILKKIDFDVIHVQQEFGISIFGRLCAKAFDVPLVYTCHTSYESYTNYLSHGKKIPDSLAKRAVKSVIRRFGQSDGLVIVPSYKAMHMLRQYGVDKSIAVVPNAIDLSRFYSPIDTRRKDRFLKEHNLQGKRIVLWLGRIGKEKNLGESIEYFLEYLQKTGRKDVVLLIVGDGPEKEGLMKKYHGFVGSSLFFVGKVEHDDTPFFYKISDFFLSSSTTETQGLTYSEAMASETVVLAKYDFNLEPLIVDGVTGFLYDEKKSMFRKMDTILDMTPEERALVARQGFNRCLALYSPQSYYERLINVYERAIRQDF